MSRIKVYEKSQVQQTIESIYAQLSRRLNVSSLVSCPVEFSAAFVNLCAAQSCGKCTPCRVGLKQMHNLLSDVLDAKATLDTLDLIQELAEDIYYSSDCAIGYESAALVLKSLRGFRDDYEHHIINNTCGAGEISPVPCRAGCPAEVDVPGYLALIAAGRYIDAIRLIRKDNPLAIVCGLVCEHPCEMYCRRGKVDDPINIRGLKRFAADNAANCFGGASCISCETGESGETSELNERDKTVETGESTETSTTEETTESTENAKTGESAEENKTANTGETNAGGCCPMPIPAKAASTGKRVAVVGGGPAGLTAAYYLALMGHFPVIYEQRKKLGGMLRYGIPSYRLPRVDLDNEIEFLLSCGIDAKCDMSVGSAACDSSSANVTIERLRSEYDAIFIAIGAHADKKLGIDGEDASGVLSAVQFLRDVGDDKLPDFSGKTVVVVGGGNVAMDVARTSLRLNASKVRIAYRRRQIDMTAQEEEIQAAIAEGCELLDLRAPVRIETSNTPDGVAKAVALIVQPQIIGEIRAGRASQSASSAPEERLEADIVMVAIGQDTDSESFAKYGLPTKRNMLISDAHTAIPNECSSASHSDCFDGIFTGGECVTGPATVIRAVSAGKAAAAAIDNYLGYKHIIEENIQIPEARFKGRMYCARSNTEELNLHDLPSAFSQVEKGLLPDEAKQEAERCLRCDHFGSGAFRGGRYTKW